ncbi:unnamed protein product [Bursaphelenchus okinawaensis]|uniref:NAD(+) ADP-ribosyltransferase n=1 Tax=Bursaphelenchus okinawaensis TaxID=465554 RepID=A0A811KWM5_9BILA|nr:unnamed protein product [Bursaphelenchus okinawaensis]CAG9113080.1 unnamed protein product [Bursaphelenchus okinawaensis]
MERNHSVRFSTSTPIEHRVTSDKPSDDGLQKLLAMLMPQAIDDKYFDRMDPFTAASLDMFNPRAGEKFSIAEKDINRSNVAGWTPLMYAIYLGHYASATVLVKNGAAVETKNSNGQTPLILAASCSSDKMVDLLLTHNACIDVVDQDGRSALHYAALYDQETVVLMLLNNGADPNMPDKKSGSTPLLMACEGGKIKIIHEMLMHGGDPKLRNGRNYSGEDLVQQTESKHAINLVKQHVDFYETLRQEGLEKYIPNFQSQHTTWSKFLKMGPHDFDLLGIDLLGPKKKLENIRKGYLNKYGLSDPGQGEVEVDVKKITRPVTPKSTAPTESTVSAENVAKLRIIQRQMVDVHHKLSGFLSAQKSISEADLRSVVNTVDEINSRISQLL